MSVKTPAALAQIGGCLPCMSPRVAQGNGPANHMKPMVANPKIKAGQWVRFAGWPLSPDNPPRKVDHLTAKECVCLVPATGWRTYARAMDLVEVPDTEMQTYVAAGGPLPGFAVAPTEQEVTP